ncbi:MAG: dihydropteroate synthase [Verrucomicrobiales bacterium]
MKPDLLIPRAGRTLTFERPLVMGILNLNDDSFCGDGTLDQDVAAAHVKQMLADGADIIDVGAESARTNRAAISVEEEIARLAPFLAAYPALLADAPRLDEKQLWPPVLSINTWRPEVVENVLPLGGELLNDMSALPDERNARLCARHGAALLIMHSVGEPKVPHTHCRWENITVEINRFFGEKLALATAAGLDPHAIVLDPGIDFAKQKDDNLQLLRECGSFAKHERPILLPVSRKTVIGETLGLSNPLDRDAGTIACLAAGMLRLPALIFRVHNVRAAAQAIRVLQPVV